MPSSRSTFIATSVRSTEGKGRGVFAETEIEADALIESCHIIVVPTAHRESLDSTVLHDYWFAWGTDSESAALALGNGSLYNHSYQPNARYERNLDCETIEFFAIRTIYPGDEITVNYNGEPADKKPIWFSPVPEDD